MKASRRRGQRIRVAIDADDAFYACLEERQSVAAAAKRTVEHLLRVSEELGDFTGEHRRVICASRGHDVQTHRVDRARRPY